MMKKKLSLLTKVMVGLLVMLTAVACKSEYATTKVIKPKKHLFVYNPKIHGKMHLKRTKTVKMKN